MNLIDLITPIVGFLLAVGLTSFAACAVFYARTPDGRALPRKARVAYRIGEWVVLISMAVGILAASSALGALFLWVGRKVMGG